MSYPGLLNPTTPPSVAYGPSPSGTLGELIRAVLDREPFIAVTGDDPSGLETVLDAAMVALAGRDVRFVRIPGELSAPLTVGTLIRQIGGDELAGGGRDGAERLLQALSRLGDEGQVVLAVEHAETLQPQALSFLQLLPAIHAAGSPALQVLFVGRPGLWRLLENQAFHPIRDQLLTRIAMEQAEQPSAPPAPEMPPTAPPPGAVTRRYVTAAALLVAAAGVTGLYFVAIDFFYRGFPSPFVATHQSAEQAASDAPGRQAAAAPATTAAPPPVLTLPAHPASSPPDVPPGAVASSASLPPSSSPPAATPSASPPSGVAPSDLRPVARAAIEERERLRREFDAFLDRSDAARLTAAQRDLLFEQYLARRNGVASDVNSRRGTIRRVVINYAGRSGEADATRLQAVLRPNAEKAETRPVADASREPVIRYFFVEDEPAANEVAADLRATGTDWHVQDYTAQASKPARGTVEVWVPQP